MEIKDLSYSTYKEAYEKVVNKNSVSTIIPGDVVLIQGTFGRVLKISAQNILLISPLTKERGHVTLTTFRAEPRDCIKITKEYFDTKLWPKIVKTGNSYFYRHGSESTTNRVVKTIKSLITKVFPEERVDVRETTSTTIRATIHYPELTITNTPGQSYTMEDFWVEIMFTNFTKTAPGLMGWQIHDILYAKTTFAPEELIVGRDFYVHSHMPRTSAPWKLSGNFCYGATTISQQLSKLKNFRHFNFLDLTAFLVQLDATLQWESIEGNPYAHISDLSQQANSVHLSDEEVDDLVDRLYIPTLEKLLEKYSNEEITQVYGTIFEFIGKDIVIGEDQMHIFDDVIKEVLETTNAARGTEILFPRQGGVSVQTLNTDTNSNKVKRIFEERNSLTDIVFKGEEIPCKLVPTRLSQELDKELLKPHHHVVKEIMLKLRSELDTFLITNISNYDN